MLICASLMALAVSVQAPGHGQFHHPTLHYSFSYPARWILDSRSVDRNGADGPMLRTFPKRRYAEGGITPKGGATISVQGSPSSNFPLGVDDYARLSEMAAQQCGCVPVGVRQRDGTLRFDFTDTWEAGTFKDVWMSRTINGRLVVMMLSYYADDRRGLSYERDLEGILSSVSAAPPSER